MLKKFTNYVNKFMGNPYPTLANAILEKIKNKAFPDSKAPIYNLSVLCSYLESALKKVILLEQYDQLDMSEKQAIEQCIVEKLLIAAKRCVSDNVNRIREGDIPEKTGLQMQLHYSREFDHFSGEIAVHFPYKLFNFEKKLTPHIVRALIDTHSSILVNHAKYYLIDKHSRQNIREVRKKAIVLGYLSQKQTLFTTLPYEINCQIASLTIDNNENNPDINLYEEANIAYTNAYKK